MRAAIFDPYLDTGGGGERYILTFALALKKAGWQVDLQWKDEKILPWLSARLGLHLGGVNAVPDISKGAGYDLCFWISDGSIPLLFSNKNILHFQTPFHGVGGKNILNRLKFLKIQEVVCNSNFTKIVIDREYGIKSRVLYPPVDTKEFKEAEKENIILSVGRFSQLQQAKRQDVLIEAFKKMCKKGLTDWQLVLIGGSNVGGEEFANKLKVYSKGYPIKILENAPFSQVKEYYGKSKFFWSAAGFGVNEKEQPQKVEHFGISVVEAMSAGCVPVVTNKGGHREIINDGVNGFLWETEKDLQSITSLLMLDERRSEQVAKKAKTNAVEFAEERFAEEVLQLVR